ncbi:MAG: metallophosphoesterase [Planctomycetes bacterium]|nr:metallophosphoesterase [Planctomycetota bacterium]
MPNTASADTAIQLMQQAEEANWSDPCRQGALIDLPAYGDLVMTGDLHGHSRNYQRILEIAALHRHRRRHLILHEILHGLAHTPDGCDLSYQVLEMAARLKIYFPDQVHLLMGNHDLCELMGSDILKGGRSSLKGLGNGLAVAYGERGNEVREAYHEFLLSFPVAARTSHGLFISHSIPEIRYSPLFSGDVLRKALRPEDLGREGYVHRLVWGRRLDQETADQFAQVVGAQWLITGHQPAPEGFAVPNTRQIVLDSKDDQGCYMLIPLDQELTHNDLIERIRRLSNNVRVV